MKYKLLLKPSNIELSVSSEETILASALAQNIHLNHSCRNGRCGVCKSVLLDGEISAIGDCLSLSDEELGQGIFLSCSAKASADLVVEAECVSGVVGSKPKIFPAKVSQIHFCGADIAVIKFRLPPTIQLEYLAGQCLELIVGNCRRTYSFANAPSGVGQTIELHVKKMPNGEMSEKVFGDFEVGSLVRMNGPLGSFFVRESVRPLLFLATGTGFAPIKAMIENLLEADDPRPIHLYWGGRTSSDLYSQLPQEWNANIDRFVFVPVLSRPDSTWPGREGYVHHAAANDLLSIDDFDVYACGSIRMIDSARAHFVELGLSQAQFYFDAFVQSS